MLNIFSELIKQFVEYLDYFLGLLNYFYETYILSLANNYLFKNILIPVLVGVLILFIWECIQGRHSYIFWYTLLYFIILAVSVFLFNIGVDIANRLWDTYNWPYTYYYLIGFIGFVINVIITYVIINHYLKKMDEKM